MRGSRPRSRVPRRRASSAPRVRPVACAALYCLRSTYVAAETRGDGRFRRLCAPYFSLPRWRYFFEAQRTRPLFARASQLCSRPCFNLRGTPPASLARAVLGVSHVVLADSGSADERLLLAIQKPEVTDVGLNSVRVGCHLVGWLRGCVVARLLGCRRCSRCCPHHNLFRTLSPHFPPLACHSRHHSSRSGSAPARTASVSTTRWPATLRTRSTAAASSGAPPRPLTRSVDRSLATTRGSWRI